MDKPIRLKSGSTDNVNRHIEPLTLPRPDWYDQVSVDETTGEIVGRIYKDALIENFNAIEEKLNYLGTLEAKDIVLPVFSEMDYPDVTLDSPDNKVVNLKSLLTILNCIGIPLECDMSGSNVIAKLTYYSTDMSKVQLKNIRLTGVSSDKPYVILDYSKKTKETCVEVVAELPSDMTNKILLAFYSKGKLLCLDAAHNCDVNLLEILSRMSVETYDIVTPTVGSYRDNSRVGFPIMRGGRTVGYQNFESKSGNLSGTYTDIGRKRG